MVWLGGKVSNWGTNEICTRKSGCKAYAENLVYITDTSSLGMGYNLVTVLKNKC